MHISLSAARERAGSRERGGGDYQPAFLKRDHEFCHQSADLRWLSAYEATSGFLILRLFQWASQLGSRGPSQVLGGTSPRVLRHDSRQATKTGSAFSFAVASARRP